MTSQASEPTVKTLGHSNRDRASFLELLETHGVRMLVDVRSRPRSRFQHFCRDRLRELLAENGIHYEHRLELGGIRDGLDVEGNTALPPGFQAVADYLNSRKGQAALEDLEGTVRETEGLVLLCAEKEPDRCHRKLIADHLLTRGVRVLHLVGNSQEHIHELDPRARIAGDRVRYPGLI